MERSFGQMLSHVSKKKLCFGWPRNAIKEEKLLDKASDRADAYAATLSTSVILSNTDRKNSANVITRVGRAPAIHVSQAGNSLRAETRPSTSRSNRTESALRRARASLRNPAPASTAHPSPRSSAGM